MEPITLTAVAIGKLIAAKMGVAHLGATALTMLGAAAITTTIVVGLLTIDLIADWFQKRQRLCERDGNVAVTIKTRLESGKYGIIQGVFNKNKNTLEDGQVIQCDNLDSELQEAHRKNDLVIYPTT